MAATAVGRRVGLPRRALTVLEGESLVNDATAPVALGAATAAITETVTPLDVGLDFLLAVGGGLAIGLAVTWLPSQIRRRIADPMLDTTLSLSAPFVAFLPAEAIHASGVLCVVVTGYWWATGRRRGSPAPRACPRRSTGAPSTCRRDKPLTTDPILTIDGWTYPTADGSWSPSAPLERARCM